MAIGVSVTTDVAPEIGSGSAISSNIMSYSLALSSARLANPAVACPRVAAAAGGGGAL